MLIITTKEKAGNVQGRHLLVLPRLIVRGPDVPIMVRGTQCKKSFSHLTDCWCILLAGHPVTERHAIDLIDRVAKEAE